MKKLFDSKFLFIVALSLVVLIILGIGAFYLFDDKDDTFVKNGYVINPLSGKVEKYLFNENTPYKENLSSMIVFKDVDNKNASILKDSFLHYNDGSLSFLTNGAILDLDTINGSETVNYYNITNASIIEKKGDKYVIKNSGNDINLKNFIGRISEDKFIVVGKIEAQIPGNEKNISADYFEIVYSEKGVVNIENKDTKFQVTAEGTIIHIGNIAIDLGAKKISRNGEDVMSLTAITINGDENIEIIPETEKEEEEGNGSEDGTNATDNAQNGNGADGEGSGSGQGGNGGEGDTGEGGTGKENTEIDTTQDIIVSLKKASIGSTSVDVTFDMYNTIADDNFSLKVTNLESGRTVDLIETISANEEIRINLLSPNTKYLFTVTNDRDGNKYFQKIFQTNDFGIKLEKTYATDSELGFKVIVDKDTDISNAKLALYKYNEITKQNEIVTTSYYDNVANETKYSEKVTYLSSMTGNIEGVHEIVYDGLDSNTIYTAVLDEFSLVSVNFKDVYNITETVMTLKKTPEFSDMTVSKDVGAGTFKLSLKDIVDKDNAIESYTYRIYEVNNPDQTVISPITKTNASPIEIKIGDKENQLKNDTNYFYKIIVEYFDNEKYVEYILDDTINFFMGDDPYITVVPNEDKISYDTIAATIYLTDNSCIVSMPGREKCIGPSSTRINVYNGNTLEYSQVVDFDVTDEGIKYDFERDGLQAGTRYRIEVEAVRNDELEKGSQVLLTTEESKNIITTKTLTHFTTEWVDNGSNAKQVVNLQTSFIAEASSGSLGPDESAASIKKVIAKLYNGSYVEDLAGQEPIAVKTFVNSDNFNIKDKFYDHKYNLTTDVTFGLDIAGLKALNNNELSEYYTVAIYAYYDENGTNEVTLTNNVISYKINPAIDIGEPEIYVEPRTKAVSGITSNLINSGTVVGYIVTGGWDSTSLSNKELTPTTINMYVYNENGQRVSFYIKNGNNLVLVDAIENVSLSATDSSYSTEIYMDYGSDYNTVDTTMSRGNNYYIGYQLVLSSPTGNVYYPSNMNEKVPVAFGKYSELIKTEKETPTVTMYIAKSTANSVKYRYTVKDPDNALYKENDSSAYGYYYAINDGEEVKLNLTKNNEITAYNAFTGDFTINDLSNGDTYYLYYKKNVSKTGNLEQDVLKYFDGTDSGKRLFDGYYDATDEEYNFKYEVINPKFDNKVTIKILADEKILDRIVNYEVTFTDSVNSNNKLVKNLWKLSACPDANDADRPRCFSVDYVELKNHGMKSSTSQTHEITVNVVAFYDNGLTGYDYVVGSSGDYEYMIFQNNLIPGEEAKYVTFTKADTIAIWTPDNDIAKGYYTYKTIGRSFDYTNILRSKTKPINYTITGAGYSSIYGILNPKMISKDSMTSTNKKFSFSSITPKVKIDKTVSIINGAIVNLSLSGADMEDFCEEGPETDSCNNNSDFYLYIDVWNYEYYANQNNSFYTVRPTVKVKINKENPAASLKAVIDGLAANSKSYYNVYAYLNKNGHPTYTQLYDIGFEDKYEVKTYNFTSLSSNDLYRSHSVNYRPNLDGAYSDKMLDTTINLISYANNIPFNFDLGYAFCEDNDFECGIGDDNTNIFKTVINSENVKTVTTDSYDISDKNIEFGTNYFMKIVAAYDYYYKNPDTNEFAIRKVNLSLNGSQLRVWLRSLVKPNFLVERKAVLVDGKYAIDLTVNVNDPDRVLDNGEYFVSLMDDNNLVGDLQVIQNDNYVTVSSADDYDSYAFDALVSQKQIRITNLEPDKLYTVYVFSTAYINNYDTETLPEERHVNIGKGKDDGIQIYTTNNAGVAFGRDIVYTATDKTFVISFTGGSSFDNVREVGYTIARWGSNASDFAFSGNYIIGENNKRFERVGDQWKFIIDDERINNIAGITYYIALSFKVVNGEDEYNYYGDDESHPITNNPITNPEFFGRATIDNTNSNN